MKVLTNLGFILLIILIFVHLKTFAQTPMDAKEREIEKLKSEIREIKEEYEKKIDELNKRIEELESKKTERICRAE